MNKLVKSAQAKLDTLTVEITKLESRLKTLKAITTVATKNLEKIGDRDKIIRESLATQELKLQKERTSLKTQKADMKKQLIAEKEQQPTLKVPKSDGSKGYYKI